MSESILFDSKELLPAGWRQFAEPGPVRAFNPSLLRDGDEWIFAYRVVGPDQLRRIALCRLDRNFQIIAGSQVAFSPTVQFAPGRHPAGQAQTWFADPRLYRLAGRLFVYWNSGWHDPFNHQFIQEIDLRGFRPIGFARELNLIGQRQKLEKNWTLLGDGGDGLFYAIYSIAPHRVLQFSLEGDGAIDFTEAGSTDWNNDPYASAYGNLRGGAGPQFFDGRYWSFCHSVHNSSTGYRYVAAVYRFSAAYPFAPTDAPARPLSLENPFGPKRIYEKLNPAVGEVIYPCGAAYDQGRWVISYGINDEHCAITRLTPADVMASLRAIDADGPATSGSPTGGAFPRPM
jgi:predicted GH43/DUF377 family glycosyl hydrolase